ncbi:MAG: MBL fold metallo-hydrolase [Desulfurobacterium sp.]|nr:MAG: MBL fold metallo-hydrolase [Desulfurobacterium sp.]
MESLVIVYDNRATEGFKADWGFSALVELEDELILFDTGASPEVLKENLELAEVAPEEIDVVFISHNHWDHTGGLPFILERNREVELFVPESSCSYFEELLPETAVCVPVSEPVKISERALSTGVLPTGMDNPKEEQALIVGTPSGYLLLVGCAHPGIVEIAKKAVSLVGEELFLIVGGFHLYNSPKEETEKVAEELLNLTRFVAPCHCTGDVGIEVFRRTFGDRFIEVKAGVEIPLEEDVNV